MFSSLGRLAPLVSVALFAAACSSTDDVPLFGNGTNADDDAAGGPHQGAGGNEGTGGTGAGGGAGGLLIDASSGTTPDPDAGCLTTTSKSTRLPANLMLQLDMSNSMKCLPTDVVRNGSACLNQDRPGSRWRILRDALIQGLDSIPDDANVGLMHYPLNDFICVNATPDVPLAPLSQNRATLVSRLNTMTPSGGTPTHDAAAAAYAALANGNVTGNKYIVLATDGQAGYCFGCVDEARCDIDVDNQLFIDQVADAFAKDGLRLFVIGVPGSEGYRAVLSRLAAAGGTAKAGCSSGDIATSPSVGDCHYDMTTNPANFGQAIAAALAAISGQMLSCTYDVPPPDAGAFDPGKVNVELTEGGATSEILHDPSKMDGWDYSSDGEHIELYGAACDRVKTSEGGQVDIVYGCPTHAVR